MTHINRIYQKQKVNVESYFGYIGGLFVSFGIF